MKESGLISFWNLRTRPSRNRHWILRAVLLQSDQIRINVLLTLQRANDASVKSLPVWSARRFDLFVMHGFRPAQQAERHLFSSPSLYQQEELLFMTFSTCLLSQNQTLSKINWEWACEVLEDFWKEYCHLKLVLNTKSNRIWILILDSTSRLLPPGKGIFCFHTGWFSIAYERNLQ